MVIQDQIPLAQVDDEHLSFFKAIGVDYVTVHVPLEFWEEEDRTEEFVRLRKLVESHGMKLNNLATKCWNEIILGLPGRDEKIETWCRILRTLGRAGVPTLGYDFMVRYFRTAPVLAGRGGAKYSTLDYEVLMQDPPRIVDEVVAEPQMVEHLQYFLERVIPVAEETGVLMALHPDDPPIPEPLGGVARIVSTLDQYERIFEMQSSRCNAMLFCQGCVAEMGENVPAAIQRMGNAGRIAYVHFRNIRGIPKQFEEVFVDEGDQDMFEAMQAYRDIGFNGPFMMDHTPGFPNPEMTFWAGKAYAVGYIRAMIQAVYR